ncbi:hypothetical protein [Deinococcus xianganensis]|uniref:Uncharacterized protein n=1 Tax=Deinococcus xianganensis TaxID=1507289 RepID=A0A6I4YIH8_9DEIO|nr:hypothetical protein [Deinococcus xianganensis]MXV21292.1 hypothetical protein [Deinococcus xianganensis]
MNQDEYGAVISSLHARTQAAISALGFTDVRDIDFDAPMPTRRMLRLHVAVVAQKCLDALMLAPTAVTPDSEEILNDLRFMVDGLEREVRLSGRG